MACSTMLYEHTYILKVSDLEIYDVYEFKEYVIYILFEIQIFSNLKLKAYMSVSGSWYIFSPAQAPSSRLRLSSKKGLATGYRELL